MSEGRTMQEQLPRRPKPRRPGGDQEETHSPEGQSRLGGNGPVTGRAGPAASRFVRLSFKTSDNSTQVAAHGTRGGLWACLMAGIGPGLRECGDGKGGFSVVVAEFSKFSRLVGVNGCPLPVNYQWTWGKECLFFL